MHPVADDRDHRWNQLGRVLIIRVDHDDDVGPRFERQAIAALLVSTVALVHVMNMDLDAFQTARDGNCVIAAFVVHQDDAIDQLLVADFVISLSQGFGGVIRRHHHHHFLISIHSRIGFRPANLSTNNAETTPL